MAAGVSVAGGTAPRAPSAAHLAFGRLGEGHGRVDQLRGLEAGCAGLDGRETRLRSNVRLDVVISSAVTWPSLGSGDFCLLRRLRKLPLANSARCPSQAMGADDCQ
jgi:hypothetical protein